MHNYRLDNFLAIRSGYDAANLIAGVEMPQPRADVTPINYSSEITKRIMLGIDDGTAYISIAGVICNCPDWAAYYFDLCQSSAIRGAIELYAKDSIVDRICFVVDSPGGETAGITNIIDSILASGKETLTIIGNNCCSAAYWIASVTDKIYARRGSCVGSIGVYVAWDNITELYAKIGIKTELFTTGELKAAGMDSIEPTDAHRAFIQSHVSEIFGQFKADVLRKRKVGSESMNGGFWLAAEALKRGLIDAII